MGNVDYWISDPTPIILRIAMKKWEKASFFRNTFSNPLSHIMRILMDESRYIKLNKGDLKISKMFKKRKKKTTGQKSFHASLS